MAAICGNRSMCVAGFWMAGICRLRPSMLGLAAGEVLMTSQRLHQHEAFPDVFSLFVEHAASVARDIVQVPQAGLVQ